jgi:flagellar biosynthetic protein FliR
LTLGTEAIIGLTLGMGAAIFIAAAESAGDMLAVQMGLSGANVLNPVSGTQMPIVGQFMGLFVMALLLASGGHMALLDVLSRSLTAFPPGSAVDLEGGLTASVGMVGHQFVLGLRFAAPVVAAMMIGNAILGVMAKTVPQLNVLMMAFPLQIGIGLFTLALSLTLIAGFFGNWPEQYADLISDVLGRFVPAGGGP